MNSSEDVMSQAFDLVGEDTSEPMTDFEASVTEQKPAPRARKKTNSVPKRSEEEWVAIIKESPFSIRDVNKRMQTDDMVLAAVIEGESEFKLPNGDVMKSSMRPLLNDKSIAKARINTHVLNELLKANPWRIPEVPEKKLNRALVRTAVENSAGHPEVLSLVPDKFKTKPICTLAVEEDPRALQYVPDAYKTRKLCKSAVERDESVIQWVPKGYIDVKTRKHAEKALKAARAAEEKANAEAEAKAAEAKAKAEEEAAKAKAAAEEARDAADMEAGKVEAEAEKVETKLAPKAASKPASAPRRPNPLRLHFRAVHRG